MKSTVRSRVRMDRHSANGMRVQQEWSLWGQIHNELVLRYGIPVCDTGTSTSRSLCHCGVVRQDQRNQCIRKYLTARPPLASAELLESVGDWESGSQHVEDYRSREDYQDRRTCVLLKHRCDRCERDEQGVNELTQNAQKPLSPAASA